MPSSGPVKPPVVVHRDYVTADAAHPAPLVDGVAIRLADGKDWIVPPLRIDQLLVHLPMLKEIGSMSPNTPWAGVGSENICALCEMILDAMQRNYPTMTKENVQSLCDLRTLGQVIKAVLDPAHPAAAPQTDKKTDG